jgi:anti-sigma regulatory factor (Ser/Thr protein kinase)
VVGSPPDPSTLQAARLLLDAGFTVEDVTAVRRRVEEASRDAGLDPSRVDDWITAVNELMTNAVRHGGGRGRVRLWRGARLTCEVSDGGPGFPADDYLARRERPAVTATGGIGLWIVRQLTDSVHINSGPGGTTARISVMTDS